MTFAATPVLENEHVRLEQLGESHHEDLVHAADDGELWRAWYTWVPSPDQVAEEIALRLGMQEEGELAPWAVIDRRAGKAVGMTTFLNLVPEHRRLEIGSTWLGRSAQGSAINPAMKMLMLQRAFEELNCIAVEFRTHWHNQQSRAAIARLGAKQDGVLRNHRVMDNGTIRDTVVFSILDSEWPAVKAGLTHRLERRR